MTGLAVVPVLPYLFDKPVEHVTDRAFEWAEDWWLQNRARNLRAKKEQAEKLAAATGKDL
jgi:fission process protein 1